MRHSATDARACGGSWGAAAFCALLLLLAPQDAAAAQRVTFPAEDGVTIAATWYEPQHRPGPAVILVHMLTRSRQEWDGLAQRLAREGVGALAIDLRGHGESPGGAAAGDYAAMLLDLRAAKRYLSARPDVRAAHIGILGASLGANLAVLAAAEGGVAGIALLSPSLDYRGVRIEGAARKLSIPVLLVASEEDPYALRSARDLQKAGGGPRELRVLRDAGHGTVMLARDSSLGAGLVDWFRRTLL